MNNTPVQLALRELRATFTNRAGLAAIGLAGLVAGLTGPFNTFEALGLPLRIVYWMAIAYGTYGVDILGAVAFASAVLPSNRPRWLGIALQGLGASVPVTLTIIVLNITFMPTRAQFSDVLWLFPYCLAISTALMAVVQLLIEPQISGTADGENQTGPRLLERLPHEIRGPLSHLSMADHYVEVFTTKGKAMVLMRLADAIRETEGIPGLQIHRSHWVAKDAVKAIRRVDGKTMVETKSGALLPVSRSFLPAVRAGLG